MAIVSREWKYVEINDAFCAFLGYEPYEFIGHTPSDLGLFPLKEDWDEISRVLEGEGRVSKALSRLRARNGELRYGQISLEEIDIDGQPHWLMIISDVSDLMRAEEHIRKLNRVYAVLSDINQSIVRIHSAEQLFAEVCRIAVEKGSFGLAWLGLVDAQETGLRTIIKAGKTNADLDSMAGSLWADIRRVDFQKTQKWLYNNLSAEVGKVAWLSEAKRIGLNSFVAYPLKVFGKIRGLFCLYSSETDFFDSDEIKLLDEMAMDISFAMEYMGNEAERQRAETALQVSEERYRTVADYTYDWEYWLAPDRRVLYSSPSSERVTGYRPQEFIDNPLLLEEIIFPEDRHDFESHLGNVVSDNFESMVHRMDFRIRRRDGNIRWIGHACQEILRSDGTSLGRRVSNRDITDRKLAEESVRKLNAELEERVRERTAELEEKNQELEAFTYSISHDLRAPLRAIDGFSRIILDDFGANLEKEARSLLDGILNNTKEMSLMISGMLALSRAGRSELTFVTIDMTGLASSIFKEIAGPDIQKEFIFSISPLPEAYGDQTLIRQVWSNILSNAIKYTLPKEERRIEIGNHRKDGMLIYYIRDSGVGFEAEYSNKLFGVFQRLHSAQEFEGTGVGLAIVKRIIQRHGGSVWAEGRINQGATIYFSLPEIPGRG